MKRTISRSGAIVAVGVMLSLLAACTTTGMGGGDLERKGQPEEPVMFSWKSDDGGISGVMIATLPGATYRGPFFQITQQTEQDSVAPLWDGWDIGWTDWPFWGFGAFGPYEWTEVATRYSGKVLANLSNPAGKHMRCRLHLAKPAQGMSGGGDGECQLQDGGVIYARF